MGEKERKRERGEKERNWKRKNFPRWARPWDAVHSHGRVSLNIIWRWSRLPIVDSPSPFVLRPSFPFLTLFLFNIPWIQRPCDYASPFCPPSFPTVRLRPCRPSKPCIARARTRARISRDASPLIPHFVIAPTKTGQRTSCVSRQKEIVSTMIFIDKI